MIHKKLLTTIILLFSTSIASCQHHHHTSSNSTLDSTPISHNLHSSGDREHQHHHHKTVTVSNDRPIPNVDLIVTEDSMKGWNLKLNLTNFELTPENVNLENKINQGHAHLYINDKKITRIYSDWYYIDKLPPGDNTIKISLNTNKHESLVYQNKPIEAIATVTVPQS